ncbi:MAG: hypothetical protein FWF97_00890 [Alphaproteobacteria bacterium]|nr:hypothetical protein [Alphaproteobacteria bacterium]
MKSRFFVYFAFALCAAFALPALGDPIAGYDQTVPAQTTAAAQSGRSGAANNRTGRAQTTSAAAKAGATTGTSRGTAATGQTSRGVAQRGNAASAATPRNVVTRPGSPARSVTARTATMPAGASQARISLRDVPIRASAGVSASNTLLQNRLYTGTYSNIIDPTTGLISADAYANCLESYYTCMDEICTARNPGQRRCACAGRVKTFSNVEAQLQQAKEDLLKVSGQLSMLIMTRGKSMNEAFQLTDAEKTLNCVSWRDAKTTGQNMTDWCNNHMMGQTAGYSETCNATTPPSYCTNGALGLNSFNEFMSVLNGADSDILANLQTYASTINQINVITGSNDGNLFNSFMNVSDIVGQMADINLFNTETSADFLARLWGYQLFQYGHNNVCNRVLDSCFNGIYEACGSYGGTTGPYNLNSTITVSNDGSDLNFVNPGNSYTGNTSAACYGYTTSSGDPYANLRRPVADARRSILQKYALDANADCDLYGEELKKQATNMAYQKIAATQYLQQKRLEFAQEETTNTANELATAKENYKNCVNEIYDCFDQQNRSNPNWTVARVRNYCSQSSEVPSCYDTMVCGQGAGRIIDVPDSTGSCNNSQDWSINNCRNVVRLTEILNVITAVGGQSSASLRESCLRETPGVHGEGSIRDFGTGWGPGVVMCPPYSDYSAVCEGISSDGITSTSGGTNGCVKIGCRCFNGYKTQGGQCVPHEW